MAAGIFGVISIIIAADIMRDTGRFTFFQGRLVALATGLASFALFMPETGSGQPLHQPAAAPAQ